MVGGRRRESGSAGGRGTDFGELFRERVEGQHAADDALIKAEEAVRQWEKVILKKSTWTYSISTPATAAMAILSLRPRRPKKGLEKRSNMLRDVPGETC